MKRFIFLLGIVILCACEESENTPRDKADVEDILRRLEDNEIISYEIFNVLAERMTSDSLHELRETTPDRKTFIAVIARQTDDYFEEVVAGGNLTFDVTSVPTPFSGEAEITLKALASTPAAGAAPFDMIDAYSKFLSEMVEQQSAQGRKSWILMESGAAGVKGSGSQPSEDLSLNYTKLTQLTSIPHSIMMDLSLTDEQMLTELNNVLQVNDIPPVAIYLLLPAVQRIRDTNSEQPFEKAMNTWLTGPVTATSDHGLDRDIIRRIQATVFLAALHTILLDEYRGANRDMASLSVLHARYRAAVIMGAREMWKD